jgi:hypothetical protein
MHVQPQRHSDNDKSTTHAHLDNATTRTRMHADDESTHAHPDNTTTQGHRHLQERSRGAHNPRHHLQSSCGAHVHPCSPCHHLQNSKSVRARGVQWPHVCRLVVDVDHVVVVVHINHIIDINHITRVPGVNHLLYFEFFVLCTSQSCT